MNFSVFNILILIGCIQGFLLAFLLARGSKFNRKSNAYLALFIFSFSLNNLYYFSLDVGVFQIYPILFFVPFTWGLLMPFAFFYFVEYLINPAFKPSRRITFWLVLPFIIHVSIQLIVVFIFLIDLKLLARHVSIYNTISHFTEIVNMMLAIVLLVFALFKINRYQNNLKNNYATLTNKTLVWLRNLVISLFVLWGLWSIPYLYEISIGEPTQANHYPLWIGMSIVIYWIGYSTYTKSEVFEAPVFALPLKTMKTDHALSEKTEEHYQKLMDAMANQKFYLNPDLNLEMLAANVELSAGYLSQIINKKEKVNFYDFVNRYRVEEAKKIIADPKFNHYSLLAIGQEAGFNSKSTFNAAFKRYAGATLSQFKKDVEGLS
jgi:AraC-like DNA-binding protein